MRIIASPVVTPDRTHIRRMRSVCNHIIASSPDRTHTHIRRMRSVCNHHSKILQHHRIITGSHTQTYTHIRRMHPFVIITPRFYSIIASPPPVVSPDRTHMQRMRSVCNHHSKILQHHRIITESRTHKHTHTYDACDPFVVITPRFCNIIASPPPVVTPDRTHMQRMRSVCNHHSKILQHRIITGLRTHTYDVCDPFALITPRFYNIIASSPDCAHKHSHTHTTYASVCNHHSKILQHHRITTTRCDTRSHTCNVCDPFVIITPRFYNIIASSPDCAHTHTTYAIRL